MIPRQEKTRDRDFSYIENLESIYTNANMFINFFDYILYNQKTNELMILIVFTNKKRQYTNVTMNDFATRYGNHFLQLDAMLKAGSIADKNRCKFHGIRTLCFENTCPLDGKIYFNGTECSEDFLLNTLSLGSEIVKNHEQFNEVILSEEYKKIAFSFWIRNKLPDPINFRVYDIDLLIKNDTTKRIGIYEIKNNKCHEKKHGQIELHTMIGNWLSVGSIQHGYSFTGYKHIIFPHAKIHFDESNINFDGFTISSHTLLECFKQETDYMAIIRKADNERKKRINERVA